MADMGPIQKNPGARAVCGYIGKQCRTPEMCKVYGCDIEAKLDNMGVTPELVPIRNDGLDGCRGIIFALAGLSVAVVFALLIVGGFI